MTLDPMHHKSVVGTKPVDMELVYASLIAYPKDEDSKAFLEEHGYAISDAKMAVFRRGTTMVTSPYYQPFQQRRAELAPRLEAKLADDMLSNALRATNAEAFCIEKVEEQVRRGEVKDPARVARDLSQIRTQAIDKRLALQGRPTQIVEKRNTDEIIRKLQSMGVLQVEDATVVEDADD